MATSIDHEAHLTQCHICSSRPTPAVSANVRRFARGETDCPTSTKHLLSNFNVRKCIPYMFQSVTAAAVLPTHQHTQIHQRSYEPEGRHGGKHCNDLQRGSKRRSVTEGSGRKPVPWVSIRTSCICRERHPVETSRGNLAAGTEPAELSKTNVGDTSENLTKCSTSVRYILVILHHINRPTAHSTCF